MTKKRTLQILRGTTVQNNAYTGSAGELTMDTTTNELRLHDGSTAGGHIIGADGGSIHYPDYEAGVAVTLTVGQTYTATYNQLVILEANWGTSSATDIQIYRGGTTSDIRNVIGGGRGSNWDWCMSYIFLKKGQSFYVGKLSTNNYCATAYPLIGG